MVAAALVVGAGLLVPLFVSGETLRRQIIEQVDSQTGIALRLNGDVSISLLPRIAVSAERVALATSYDAEPLFAAREIRFSLRIPPLLGGTIELAGLTIIEPEFTIAPEASKTSVGDAGNAALLPFSSSQLEGLRVRHLGIENGRLVVASADGQPITIDAINVRSAFNGAHAPAHIDADFKLGTAKHKFELTINSLAEFLDTGGSDAALALETGTAKVTANGRLWQIQGGSFEGQITARVEAIDKLLVTYGQEPLGLEELSEIALQAGIVADATGFQLTDINVHTSDMTLAADLSVIVGETKPELSAIILVDKIDAAKFLTSQEESRSNRQSSLDAEIDLSPLSNIEADARIDIGQIVNGPAELKSVSATIGVHDGALEFVSLNATGIGGKALAALRLEPGPRADTRITGRLGFSGIDIKQAASLANADMPVSGSVSAAIEFAARGRTVSELRQTLALRGSGSLTSGSVSGLNLARYFDGDQASDRIDALSVDATFTGNGQPASMTGNGEWRGLPISVTAKLDVPGLIAGNEIDANISVASHIATIGYSGAISLTGTSADGTVSLDTPSLTRLADWFGQPIDVENGLQEFLVKGRLSYSPERIAFSDATVRLDGSQGSGGIEVDLSRKVPGVTATLAMKRIDVTPYLGSGEEERASLEAPGWSDAPIDFGGLGALNANLTLSTDELIWGSIKTGRTALSVSLDRGALSADLSEIALYGGSGTGNLSLKSTTGAPEFSAQFRLDRLSLLPFLGDATGFERIEGTGNIDFSVAATGRSQHQFAQSLSGRGAIEFRDGAIRGMNIPKIVRSLSSGILSGWQQSEAEATDFSALTASFQIERGLLTNEDLLLVGPLIRMTGSGRANLPEQTLAFRADPKVVTSLQGPGGANELAGLGVPIIIEGAWSSPRIYPDIKGILENPDAVLQTLQQSGSMLNQARNALPNNPGDAAGAILNSIVGSTGSSETPMGDGSASLDQAPSNSSGTVGSLLSAVLGKQKSNEPITRETDAELSEQNAPMSNESTLPTVASFPLPRPRPNVRSSGASAPVQDIGQLIGQTAGDDISVKPDTGTVDSDGLAQRDAQPEENQTEPQGANDIATGVLNRLFGQ